MERNVVNMRASRRPVRQENDEVLVDERPQGEFTRQLFLGDNLDPNNLSADYDNGVLTLRIPVEQQSKPRKVEIGAQVSDQQTVENRSSSARQEQAGTQQRSNA